MHTKALSVRTFIGAKDYAQSRTFYRELGFEEVIIDPKMSYFRIGENIGFYLQNAYVKDWVDNSMVFLEVDDLDSWHAEVEAKELPQKYKRVRLSDIKDESWGREFFLHDLSGVLWHFGIFY